MEYSNQATIQRAWMDGSHAEVFVVQDLHWPNGLTIDYPSKRFYWCDVFLGRIERVNLDGTNRQVLLSLFFCRSGAAVFCSITSSKVLLVDFPTLLT